MFITWILWTIVVFYIGHKAGYVRAHYVVSQECEKLGKFFVGDKVYECVKITSKKEEATQSEKEVSSETKE